MNLLDIPNISIIDGKNLVVIEANDFKLTMFRRKIPKDHPNPPFTWGFDENCSSKPKIAAHFTLRWLCHTIMNRLDIEKRARINGKI